MNGLYRRVNDRIEKIPLCPNGINGIIDPQIREFVEDDDGNIWFGTFMGLQKYDIKNHTYAAVNIPQYAGGLIILLFFRFSKIGKEIFGLEVILGA